MAEQHITVDVDVDRPFSVTIRFTRKGRNVGAALVSSAGSELDTADGRIVKHSAIFADINSPYDTAEANCWRFV